LTRTIAVNVEDLPENAVEVIYTKMRSQKLTLDEETTMSNAIFALLEHERYRKLAIERDFVPLLMTLMADTYYMDFEETPVDQTTGLEIPSLELRELMGQIRSNLSKRLWDISDLPEFTGKYPPNGKLVDTFCTWLSKPKAEMQICACSVLRNVAHSEQTSMLFLADAVMESRMKSLLGLLRGQTNFQVALEGLRLLKNLAFPETNKFALTHGQATLELVMSLCSRIKNLSIRCAAVATVRTLLTGSFTNVKKFLWKGNSWAPTYYFPRLLTLNWEHEDLSFRMEVAQLIGQIWRVAHKENGLVETKITDEAIRQAQGAYRNVAEPICALITDSKNPSLVTQGWLGLYLMAISKRGADEIYDFIHKSPTDQLFGDTIAALEAGSKDQDNAISLRITLMPHYVSHWALRYGLWTDSA